MTSQTLLFITSLCLMQNMAPISTTHQNARFTSSPGLNKITQPASPADQKFTNESYLKSEQILDLSNQGLTTPQLHAKLNSIDAESLRVLDISNNNLTGTVDLSRFENLNFLNCSNNRIEQLTGLYPALVRLNCSNNRLTTLNENITISLPEEMLETIAEINFDPTNIGIQNNLSNQTVQISVQKSDTTLALDKILPGVYRNQMHNLNGATFVQGDHVIEVKGNQFSYQYTIPKSDQSDPSIPTYSLTVNVKLNRQGDSPVNNPTINIPDEIGQGTVGKQDASTKQQPIHRLYNPNSGEHFYTTSAQEKNHLVRVGWKDEGIGWYAPEISMQPVYRLYNPNAGDHHYTLDVNERNTLQTLGWKYEQISFYSDEFKTIPLYRQYNPNAISGAHNYTTDKHENDTLVSLGWRPEDIAWYALKK